MQKARKTNKSNNKYTKAQWQLLATRMYKRSLKNDLTIRQLAEEITQKQFKIKKLEKYVEESPELFCDKYEALEKQIVKLQKTNFEVTRAYNSLAEMGKFAEEQGIDIKKHTKELPENNKYKDFKFSQKHEVLESGKVRSTYKLTPPKKTTKKKEEDK